MNQKRSYRCKFSLQPMGSKPYNRTKKLFNFGPRAGDWGFPWLSGAVLVTIRGIGT